MVNVELIMKIARQARKAGDLQRAVNILSGGLCTDMENRTKVLIERAKILSIMEDFRCVLHDSREITTIDPTNYRGYNHAAIGAHGCYRFDDAMIYLHTGLEKADEPMSLIVRLRIMLELEDYKDFVNDIVNAESKSSLASLANNGDNEFNKVYKALMDGSDEAFVVFRAVAFSVKGSGEKAREIVTVAVLDRPNNRSLTAVQEFLMNPNDQVELTRRDVNFELEDSPSDLDADNNELYSNGDEEEVGAADDSADEDAVDEGNEADNDHDGLNNNEFPGFEDEDVDFDDDDDEDEDEEGDGGVEVEERADSGLGEDNDLISEQEGLGVSAFDARCKMATKKLMNGDFRLAYEHFRSAEMHVGADVGAGDAAEYGVFRYCLAYSRMKLQTSDITVVQDCMTTFQESLLAFPNHGLALLGHVGTCEAKRMLNFVKDFQDLQDEGLALLEKHDFTPVKYPGSDEVIPESTAEGFKRFVDDWAELVRHQPESVAKCLHSPCGALKPEIYANDLDFKGYIELKCTERCVLQFHPSCWKQELKSRIGGSDTLGAKCWTPDCDGTIVVYNGYDEKNELSVHRSKEVAEKKTKAKKQPTHQKQHKKKEDMKRGKKKNKSGKVEEEHSTDEEKEEPERGAEKHPSVEPEPRRGSRAKEEPQQQALAAKEHQQQQQQQQQQVHAPKEHQRQQQHQQQQQQQQQQPAGATAAPAGATAALNPGEIPWESMRRVVRSDDEDEKKVEQQQQQRGGKKDRKKRKQQQQQQQQQAELIKIQFTGPRRQLLSADGGIVQQQAAEEPVAAAPSLPVLVPPVADSAAAFPSIGEACPPDGPREDPELVKKLSELIKLLTDHLRVNGPTKLSKLEEFVAECDRQVQVRIADQGGLKPYLCRAIAVEFYDDFVSLPGDADRTKREYRKIWKMNPVFTEHILQTLEEGASVSDDFGSVDQLESPFQEIPDEEEDIPSEEPVVMVSQAEQETDSDEGNVESAVNAALEEVEHQEMMTMQQQQDVQVEREVLDEKQQEEEKQEEEKKDEEEDYDDDLFQELLGERLAALERLKGQVEEAKKEREKLMELKAAQDEETKQLEELAKGKKGEFKRTMEALEARAKEHKETAAAYASELLGMQAEVNGLERKLREAERNQFFSDGDELQLDTARRRLRIARQLEDEYRRQLDDKAEFLRLQTHLLADVEDGTKEDQADLAQSLSDAVEADAGNIVSRMHDLDLVADLLVKNAADAQAFESELAGMKARAEEVSARVAVDVDAIRGAVGAGRQPVMPQLRRDDAFPSLTAMLNKLKLKDQQDVNQPTLQHNNYQAETAQPAPLPKSANEFLSFVIPKGTPGQPMPPGFYGGPAQQAGARPAPADPTMAAFWAPTTADPTVFKRRTPVPTQEFSTSAVSQAFTADPVQQFQATQQLLAQLQEQQQYLRQAALGAGAGYAGQNDDTTSAVLGMAAAKISALSASGGIVPTSAATAGDGDGHLAQASAAVGPKVMARIIVPLVHQTGLSKDIVINAVMTLKSRRGKLSGFNEEGLRNAVLDILIEEGHVRVAGVESPAPPPRPPIVLRPAPPPQCSVWNVAEVKQAGPAEFSGETSSECVICGDPLSALRREKLPCGHEYHAQCVRKWFNQKASCPLCCRHVVLDSEYPQLH